MARLERRVALVTGAASGFGEAVARRLASYDASFVTGLELYIDGGYMAAD